MKPIEKGLCAETFTKNINSFNVKRNKNAKNACIDHFVKSKNHWFNAGPEELPVSTLHKPFNKIQPTEHLV